MPQALYPVLTEQTEACRHILHSGILSHQKCRYDTSRNIQYHFKQSKRNLPHRCNCANTGNHNLLIWQLSAFGKRAQWCHLPYMRREQQIPDEVSMKTDQIRWGLAHAVMNLTVFQSDVILEDAVPFLCMSTLGSYVHTYEYQCIFLGMTCTYMQEWCTEIRPTGCYCFLFMTISAGKQKLCRCRHWSLNFLPAGKGCNYAGWGESVVWFFTFVLRVLRENAAYLAHTCECWLVHTYQCSR